MTKADIIKFLEPFDDNIEVLTTDLRGIKLVTDTIDWHGIEEDVILVADENEDDWFFEED